MRILAIAAATGLVLLAACDNQTDPAAPPTTQDALTTSTATPSPTPDEVAVTTDSVPTTAEPTTQTPTAEDGPPEMPAEAEEQTESGAEAFTVHYIDLLNYTAQNPTRDLLGKLASESCGTCGQFADTVDELVANEEKYTTGLAEYKNSTAVHTNETAVVSVNVNQAELTVVDSAGELVRTYPAAGDLTMEFQLTWADSGWLIDKIFLVEN